MIKSKLLLVLGGFILVAGTAAGTVVVLNSVNAIDMNEKIALTITLDDQEKIYDGKPLIPSTYEIEGNLDEKHHVECNYIGSLTDVGTEKGTLTASIYDDNGYLVTDKYNIKVVPCSLTVTQRDLVVKYDDVTATYGSEELDDLKYKIMNDTSLVSGDKIVSSIISDSSLKENGEVNIATKVFNFNGVDVSSNYNISSIKSKFQINKREIIIDPIGVEKLYDGKELTPSDYRIRNGSLAKGDHLEISFDEIMVTPNNYESKIKCKFYNESGKDVSSYYSYNENEIYKCKISKNVSIPLKDIEREYNGKTIEEELLSQIRTYLPEDLDVSLSDVSNLKEFILGEQNVSLDDFNFFNNDNPELNIKDYYNFVMNEILINIKKRKIEISPKDTSKIYDGEEFTLKEDNYNIDSGSLIEGHKLEFTLNHEGYEEIKNPGIYNDLFLDIKITEDGKDVTNEYYEITSNSFDVEIKKIKIRVVPTLTTKYYDGKALELNNNYKIDGNLISGHPLIASYKEQMIEVGNYKAHLVLEIKDGDNNIIDINQFYDLNLEEEFDCSITSKVIKVIVKNKDVSFGTKIEVDKFEVGSDIDNLDLKIKEIPQYHLIGTYDYEIDYENSTYNGESINKYKEYYSFEIEGTYTIEKSELYITFNDILEKKYDGKQYNFSNKDVKNFKINNEECFDIVLDGISYKKEDEQEDEFGSVSISLINIIKNAKIKINDEDVSNCFSLISCNDVNATIKKRNLKISSNILTFEYNEDHSVYLDSDSILSLINFSSIVLVEGDYYILGDNIIDQDILINLGEEPGTYVTESIGLNLNIYNSDGDEVSNKYNIDFTITYIITPQNVPVGLPDLNFEYMEDGDYPICDKYYITTNDVEISYNKENSEDITNAGVYTLNKDNFKVTNKNSNKNFYIYNNPKITINKAELKITLPKISKTYDGNLFDYDYIQSELDKITEAKDELTSITIKENSLNDFVNAGSKTISENDLEIIYDDTNYILKLEGGELVITKAELSIFLPNRSKTYDGNPFDYDDIKGDLDIITEAKDELTSITINKDSLNNFVNAESKNISEFVLNIEYDDKNYILKLEGGELVITKAELSIFLPNRSKTYDGNPFDYDDIQSELDDINKNGLASITIKENSLNDFVNAGTKTISENDLEIIYDDKNYILNLEGGKLEITKQKINVEYNVIQILDGEEITDELILQNITISNLNLGDHYIIDDYFIEEEYYSVSFVILNQNEVNVSSNYDIIFNIGIIERTTI